MERLSCHALGGTYAIAVQDTQGAVAAFRGYYRLSVTAASGALVTLEPQPSAEP